MQKTLLAVVILMASSASAQSAFTQTRLVAGCTHAHVYTGQYAGDTLWNCGLDTTTFPDSSYYTWEYFYLSPTGTFTGTLYIIQLDSSHPSTYAEVVPISGTWHGTVTAPTTFSGTFANGTVHTKLGMVQRGTRNGKIRVRSILSGTGAIQ
jgi:hypothetical protein